MGLSETLANYFDVHKHGSTVRTEILAGITTFLTMSYIVVVNPSLLTDQPYIEGVDGIAIAGYTPGEVQSMLAVVTIIAAAIATTIMAFYANRPFAQAPGLGLNAFFAFTVVGALGVPWQTALAAVFVEGLIFIALTAVGAREAIIKVFPEPVKMAVGTGIGLFLAIIGLQAMGIVVNDNSTLVTMGNLASNPIAIVSIVGLFFTFALYAANVPGSIIIGIVGTSLLGWGLTASGVVSAEAGLVANSSAATYDITPLAGAFISGFGNVEAFSFALIVITFFFVDFFDTAGTLVGVGQAGGFLNDDGDLPDIDKPLMADAVGTTAGAMLGTSTVTTYIESATGVEEGGRTGLTALVVALLFLGSLAIVPLATAIPQYASHIALVVIGVVMLRNVVDIEWDDLTFTIPAGMTILVMPFTYSIAYGIAAGIVSYPLVKVAAGEYDDVSAGQWALAVAFVLYFVVRTSGMLQAQV
ncbi:MULTISPECIES: NCS2 family permease [Haloferax]|uniref:NCS2 family permease n=4 Tax=Haloferax TaxID=2251 RepID=A0A6C0UNY6_HALVO|nr:MULTISPECIES: NCS2 family permease [Haloferax]ELK55194.1 xanthine/uracil permease family protein [Haloferax sp. BAB-2207]ELZ70776.1 xanthine/uracil permease family protein [Haloferax lucentense DSM 14919]ELZ90552.1 xanthine/uracil permease family protein [Haloferax alexandrinus JCM 10717]MBC9985123.1 NCS2 family permease [Haloferax sp. AS1]NLV01338.1 NCS2 family permease [Haloferax alexandrinus]